MWSVKTLPKARSLSFGFSFLVAVRVILIASFMTSPLGMSISCCAADTDPACRHIRNRRTDRKMEPRRNAHSFSPLAFGPQRSIKTAQMRGGDERRLRRTRLYAAGRSD